MDVSSHRASAVLDEALTHERVYEWEDAARCYSLYLESQRASVLPSPEATAISIRRGECLELAAYQAEQADVFAAHLGMALSAYAEVERPGGEVDDDDEHHHNNNNNTRPQLLQRVAMVHRLYVEGMQAGDRQAHRALLDQGIEVHAGVILELERTRGGEDGTWQKACLFQLQMLRESLFLDPGEKLETTLRGALELAQRLIRTMRSSGQAGDLDDSLAYAYAHLMILGEFAYITLEDWHDLDRQAQIVIDALALAPRVKDKRALATLHAEAAMSLGVILRDAMDEQVVLAMKAARESKDRRVWGWALGLAMQASRWKLFLDRDEEEARERFTGIMANFEEAERTLRHLPDAFSQTLLAYAYAEAVNSHYIYATSFVTENDRRRRLLESGLELFRAGGRATQGTTGIAVVHLGLAGTEVLRHLASLADDKTARLGFVTEAIETSQACIERGMKVCPLFHWYMGVWSILQGSLQYRFFQLTAADSDEKKGKEILTQAIERFRAGLVEIKKDEGWAAAASLYIRNGEFYFRFVDVLGSLFELTRDQGLVREQLRALDHAVEMYTSAREPARVAEAVWQKAKIHSRINEYVEAGQDYLRASKHYQEAAAKTQSLAELYGELAQYMVAWSHIEVARAAHLNWKYREAGESYSRAGAILVSTQRWSTLGRLYQAWTILEEAEDASQDERCDAAVELFSRVADRLADLGDALGAMRQALVNDEEKRREAAIWERMVRGRVRYCRARAEIEEAKLLDRKGDHVLSARRFARAAGILDELALGDQVPEWKREVGTYAQICHAWQLTKEAEASSDPERFDSAARIFEEIASTARTEKSGKLARANAAYCHALQFGTRLRLTRDIALYRQTKLQLEAATDYYTEVGMIRSARWTGATGRMFDGLAYLSQAESELDVRRKTDFYGLAERNFQAASKLYGEAGYREKQAQADHYIRDARERRTVFPATDPATALDTAVVMQGAQGQLGPSTMRDQPFEVERFEDANVQVKLSLDRSEITIGEDVELAIDIVSAGRSPATLVKITGISTEGLHVENVGGKYTLEEGGELISLKGLRLEPFETFELRLRLRPDRPGEFSLRPRLSYLDELGKYAERQPVAASFSVMKGQTGSAKAAAAEVTTAAAAAATAQTAIEFKGAAGGAVFDYLVSAFIEDYMMKKVYQDHSGWRSITQISEKTKIPHATLYGKQGKYGPALSELLSRGLVEARTFTGQRGRGGESVKVRIAYEKEPVKRYVDRSVGRPR